ncbi:hypothetical protein THASP1DRAFT_33183 [Thamnocephalis sphaerospora]|uniref:Uncharacterized protein n=1 Tax=Thamnocephalis sphaerospora TaxID=78915 RepID=A0A4P9XH62_9FUNG|nr:hypothetical protein THASP1DRAFT_33183 [Thamnocephalis sphaerospora]|eukprot:RKP04997.1 hypothetical protein THASP1DRAFT_33183 [Thamnocephalis sphaerospora]
MIVDGPLPPWGHACYWMTNVRHCQDTDIHFGITLTGAVMHLVPFFLGVHVLWLRQQGLWRGLVHRVRGYRMPSGVECVLLCWSLAGLARATHLLLTAFDVLPGLLARELSFNLSYYPFISGVILFTGGLVSVIPASLTEHTPKPILPLSAHNSSKDGIRRAKSNQSALRRASGYRVRAPPLYALQPIILAMLFWQPLLVLPFTVLHALAQSAGDWEWAGIWRRCEFLLWAAQLCTITIIVAYYSSQISLIMRVCFSTAEQSREHSTPSAICQQCI